MASAWALREGTRLNSASARRSLNSGPGAQRTFTALIFCALNSSVVSAPSQASSTLNFLRVELVGGVCAFASEFHTERAEVAQVDLVACKQLFLETTDCVGQNALHGTLREGRVVVGDVLAKIVQIEDFVNLCCAVGLGGIGLFGLLRAWLARHDCDTVINHSWLVFLVFGLLVIRLILSSVTIAFVTFDDCICLV